MSNLDIVLPLEKATASGGEMYCHVAETTRQIRDRHGLGPTNMRGRGC